MTHLKIYIFIHRSGRNKKKTYTQTCNKKKIEKKLKNAYLRNNLITKQLTNNVNRMLTSVNKLLLLY